MIIRCIWEHNGNDTLLYAESPAGAFTRGASLEEAIEKMPQEIRSFLEWQGKPVPANIKIEIAQEKASDVAICDADSDVLFESEKPPLTYREYEELKRLALKSARDFEKLYQSIPDQTKSCLPSRKTFYGPVPRTAQEMYIHTKNVTAYYFGEIEVDAENGGNMLSAREAAFCKLEQQPDYLQNKIFAGSYGEDWTLRKVLRRFLWHDRIHAKALYRMACKTFPDASIPNIFCFPV